jgi:hypothetical protein
MKKSETMQTEANENRLTCFNIPTEYIMQRNDSQKNCRGQLVKPLFAKKISRSYETKRTSFQNPSVKVPESNEAVRAEEGRGLTQRK